VVKPFVQPAVNRNRESLNWSSGQIAPVGPAGPTEFESLARHLRLTPQTWAGSTELRRWCERNRNRCYIPERLLALWKLEVNVHMSS